MEQENKNSNYPQENPFQENQAPDEKNKKGSFFKEIIKFALLSAVIVLPIRMFVAQPFVVSGGSMDSTFGNGQYLIVDQISYRFEDPKRGDVIIFKYPLDIKKFFIKRIIGLPLETVEMRGGQIFIRDSENKNSFALKEPYIDDARNSGSGEMSITLKDDEYFVMGDNRNESSDSRIWGPLKRRLIVGRPLVRLFPIGKISLLPGAADPGAAESGEF